MRILFCKLIVILLCNNEIILSISCETNYMHMCKPDPHPGGESFSKVFECNGNFSSIFVDLEFCSAVVDDYHHRVITDLPFFGGEKYRHQACSACALLNTKGKLSWVSLWL